MNDVSRTIIHYYESRGFSVEVLKISDISSQPLSERKYMGAKGYHVHVSNVTLVFQKAGMGGGKQKKGDRVTLTDGLIVVREDMSEKGGWIVSSISSSLMP